MQKSLGLVCAVFAIALLFAMTVSAQTNPAVSPVVGTGTVIPPGVTPIPPTSPIPTPCAPLDGVGDVCNLTDALCDCNNACGQEMINDPSFLTQYCYADCDPTLETPACPGQTEVCVPFNQEMTKAGCLPTGAVTLGWTAKLLAEGKQPNPFGTDFSRLTNVSATLSGTTFPLSMSLGMEATVEAQKFIILNFQGIQGTTGMWAMQITIPKEKFVAGTLKIDGETADFGAFLIYGEIEGSALKHLYMKALPAMGTLVIETATTPGAATKAKGTLTLDLLGFTAEMPNQ